jgi:hypothetical protein
MVLWRAHTGDAVHSQENRFADATQLSWNQGWSVFAKPRSDADTLVSLPTCREPMSRYPLIRSVVDGKVTLIRTARRGEHASRSCLRPASHRATSLAARPGLREDAPATGHPFRHGHPARGHPAGPPSEGATNRCIDSYCLLTICEHSSLYSSFPVGAFTKKFRFLRIHSPRSASRTRSLAFASSRLSTYRKTTP